MVLRKRSVLIIGASGNLGKYLVSLFETSFYCRCPTHKEFDVTNLRKNEITGYDVVINLAGKANVPQIEQDDSSARITNIRGTDYLSNNVSKESRVYHISSDYVYSGDECNSKETDLLKPFNKYGLTKALGDMNLLSRGMNNLTIIRTSFKPIIWPYLFAFNNVYTNADYIDVITNKIFLFIRNNNPAGVYNIGTQVKTVYELAKERNSLVLPKELDMNEFPYLRRKLTMDLSKYNSL